jgi:transmembrane protein TMEM260 (protein O-mannosyltransferase)
LKTSPKLLWASALAILFLIAHLVFLPSTLEDIDSLNFALGVHDFNPAEHQPHPPGYPVFIALAKLSRSVSGSDARALAVLGALFGAVAVFPLVSIYSNFEALRRTADSRAWFTAAAATALTVVSPLYWFNAERPLSDVPGLAVTLVAQAALVAAFVRQRMNPERTPEALAASGQMIVLGAFLSAIAIGMRSQAIWLTLPLLAVVLVQRAGRGAAGALLGSAMAFGIGGLLWAVPLIIATGGPVAYVSAVSAQGSADFAGVDMFYRNPTPRRLALGLLQTFIYPSASPVLGWTTFGLAAIGTLVLLRKAPRIVLLIAALTVPYLIVHLLVQETVTTRYALPLVPMMAYLAVQGILVIAPRMECAAVAALALWSLSITLPAVRVYARDGSPAFAALAELRDRVRREPDAAVGMHQGLARSVQTQNLAPAKVLKAPPMREWLELAAYWREGHRGPIWFLADPARTDIELIDPLSRHLHAHYVWRFPRERFMSGVRPDIVDLVRIDSPPGWYAEQGWHLTSETLNMSERLGRSEGVAYIRNRPGPALVVIGGEHIGRAVRQGVSPAATNAAATVSLTVGGHLVDRWDVAPGQTFFKRITLSAGALEGESDFTRLSASYAAASGAPQPVRLTQFAVASPQDLFFVQHAGWNEIEYSKELQRRWRWTTASAETFVNSGGRDVTLTIAGESPLRYFDASPRVVVRAGNQILATQNPAADFEMVVGIPAAALAAADGMITVETDKTFVPHDRTGVADRRTLGLRLFRFDVR